MTPAVLVFAALGASVAGLLVLVLRPGPSLLAAIGRLDAGRKPALPKGPAPLRPRTLTERQRVLGRRVRDRLERSGRGLPTRRAADLAITERSDELLMGRQIVAGMAGLFVFPLFSVALSPAGWRLPAPVLLVGSPLLSAAFAWLPAVELSREAETRRREFRHALSSYLDLVAMNLAGGRGAHQALAETAALSDVWAFRVIADALATSRLTGVNHWRGLAGLGERLGVAELGDLAAALALVGDHGARVRETLTARAGTLRRRALTEAEGNTEAADQNMRIAQVLLALGFLVLIAYPAMVNVLAM